MRHYKVISELLDHMQTLGWNPYQADHEVNHFSSAQKDKLAMYITFEVFKAHHSLRRKVHWKDSIKTTLMLSMM